MIGNKSVIIRVLVFKIILIAITFSQAVNAASNLLVNPGFESGSKSGWTGDGSIVSTNVHSGYKALALVGKPSGYVFSDVTVTIGSTYRFSGWLKTTGITQGNFIFRVSWYDSSNLEITSATKYFGSINVNKGYMQYSLDLKAPDRAKKARLFMIASNTNGTGYFDDLSITLLSTSTSTSSTTTTSLVANADSFTTKQNTATTYNLLANDKGVVSGTVVSIKSAPSNGQVVLQTNGTITYIPVKDYFGTDSLIYQLTNKDGSISIATASVSISCVTNCTKVFGLSWSPSTSSNIIGYKVYVGRNSGVYDQVVDVTSTRYDYKALSTGNYYFAVKSVNSLKQTSAFSAEVKAVY